IRRVGPLLCGTALLSGLAVSLLWSRLAGYLMYSLLGVTMLTGMGMLAMELSRPQMLLILPSGRTAQISTLVAMALFGAIVQWRLAPPVKASSRAAPGLKED